MKAQICEEMLNYPNVCSSLDNLDIAIGFLKTTANKGQAEENLYTYMTDVLKMEEPLKSQKSRARETSHIKSLWLLMSQQKSKLSIDLYDETQDAFETLAETVKEPLTDELQQDMAAFLQTLSVEKMTHLVEAYHEFLIIHVSKKDSTDDEDYIDTAKKSVFDYLFVYATDLAKPTPDVDINVLMGFPWSILFEHSVSAWILAYKTLKAKLE